MSGRDIHAELVAAAFDVIEAARDWATNIDHAERDLARVLQAKVETMMALEREADAAIDTSDIPEAGEEWFKRAALRRSRDAYEHGGRR